ncbi:VanZ family protein [Nitrosospira multiformis]|nr:VanZ family protein [Nitrosospira multiformis]
MKNHQSFSSTEQHSGMRILAIILLLIAYGSLYPGNFSAPPAGSVQRFLTDFHWFTSLGDVLGNIGLFFPLGMAGVIFLPLRGSSRTHIAGILFLALLFAFSLQLAQVWLPSRSPALADVVWNTVGMMLGIAAGSITVSVLPKPTLTDDNFFNHNTVVPLLVLGLWLLAELLPLVPSLDLQKVKDALKPLISEFSFSLPQTMMLAAGTLAAGSAFVTLRLSPALWLGGILIFILAGKLVIVNLTLEGSTLIGMLIGYLACLWILHFRSTKAFFEATLLLLLVAWTIMAITPFSPAIGGTLNIIPFANMLGGSIETAVRGLMRSLFIYTTLLWLMQRLGVSVMKAAIGFALWASLLELIQMGLLGRTADITEPILLLLIGWGFSMKLEYSPQLPSKPQMTGSEVYIHEAKRGSALANLGGQQWLMIVVVLFCFAIPIWGLLRLPGIPYNLREMFLGDGHFLFILVFAGALLWYGATATWMSEKIASSKLPFLQFPVWTLTLSLVSLIFLSMSVTQESLDDIVGANNLYWFVVNKDTWGTHWRSFFQLLGPDVVGPIERWMRYAGLYCPLLVFLVLALDFFHLPKLNAQTLSRVAFLIASVLPWLWLAKAVTFDWSSTDNLNELIARDGDFGWGGGGYLYILLGLLCANAVLLAKTNGDGRRIGLTIIVSISALPVAWWLLNLGLEPNVEKYGFTFSGVQFLLGPDRQNLLSQTQLFARWCAVQVGFILVTAVGIRSAWLILSTRRQRAGDACSNE